MTDHLTKMQVAALRELGEPWHYRVNWRPKISANDYAGRAALLHEGQG